MRHLSPTAAPLPASPIVEKRQHLRFDKVFPVRVDSILFGEFACVARNVSVGGMFIETREPLPLGARIRVSFLSADERMEIVALAEVKNQYFVNYADKGVSRCIAGMNVRFTGFEEEGHHILRECLDRLRVLH